MIYRALLVSVLLVVSCASLRASDVNGDTYELILLPLAFVPAEFGGDDALGALGTIWTGSVWVHNAGPTPVPLYFCRTCDGYTPGTSARVLFPIRARPDLGYLFIDVPADGARQLTFSNRLFERTRRGQPRGVDIPVVREGDFFSSQRTFLGIPTDDDIRISLRVYDPWIHYGPRVPPQAPRTLRPGPRLEAVRIDLIDQLGNVLATTTLTPEVTYSDPDFSLSRPGLAAIHNLAAVMPAIKTQPVGHLRTTPIPAGAQYWAFVSVTDNQSQTVSLITAQ
jgi:hypothetical protein